MTIFIPSVTTAHKPPAPEPLPVLTCGRNLPAHQAAQIIRTAAWQRRETLHCDDRLIAAAQWKADDLAERGYQAHDTPEGLTPNEMVKQFGFPLGLGSGNSVESILRGGNGTAGQMVIALYASESHRPHLAGEGWYSDQDCIGVGYSNRPGTEWEHWWCVLLAKEA